MRNSKVEWKSMFVKGATLLLGFVVWTIMVVMVDVKPLGQNATNIGFATFNIWFHQMSGVHMWIYNITDWFGLVPLMVCIFFGGIGFLQWIKRRSVLKVDSDILILGIYYVMVIGVYLLFEKFPINYRPVLIEGIMESSYPSSTTLLVLCVMPTLMEQIERRMESISGKKIIKTLSMSFSLIMVIGRLISGVHWFSDIVGGVLLGVGLFYVYKACVVLMISKEDSV